MTPRYRPLFANEAQAEHSVFRGQAGPLDIWEDTFDAFLPCYVIWGDGDSAWYSDAKQVIMGAKAAGVHLTLHDECRVYQICNKSADVV
jgi:hypothetical protein